jgi:serine/threonine protein kinase
MVGSKLGHYRIEAQLGAGGMGVVYRAIDERLDREVAIKAVASDEVARRRMKQEAKLLSRLNHPNVAILYEYVTADSVDGDSYLVMELVSGESLRERIQRGALPLPEIYSLCAQISAGLAAAHEAGVIHRDLKPENIVITASGTAKILDFGLSALAPSAVPTTSTTASIQLWEQNSVSGTLPYMAPEQLRGEAPDVRGDIYSAGIVFYELATGQHPFLTQTGAMMVDAILNRDVPPVSSVAPSTPPWFERVVARNASGLAWLDDQNIVYSKVIEELHMGIATGTESRTGERMIYLPPGMSSMAHRSFPSPDKRSLLIVEMDTTGTWLPCRLLPYDSSSSGRPVGPANAQCTAAGWSPDGKWMYFTSSASGAFHIWRQEFPEGAPEQA